MAARELSAFVERLEVRNLLAGDAMQVMTFAQASFDVSEAGDAIGTELIITRSNTEGSATAAVRITLETINPGEDLVAFERYFRDFSIEFGEGEASVVLPTASITPGAMQEARRQGIEGETLAKATDILTLLDDDIAEPTKTLQLQLISSDPCLVPGEIETVQVNVIDNDPKQILLSHTDESTQVMVDGAIDEIATTLNFQPQGLVVVEPEFDAAFVTVSPRQLEFTPEDWMQPKLSLIHN